MTNQNFTNSSNGVYRVDKFVVPADAKEEFIGQVRLTHDLLRTLHGFQQDFLLENVAGNGEVHVVTIVEWRDAEAIENAKVAVTAMQKEMRFNPKELIARLGIKADRGDYQRIAGV